MYKILNAFVQNRVKLDGLDALRYLLIQTTWILSFVIRVLPSSNLNKTHTQRVDIYF